MNASPADAQAPAMNAAEQLSMLDIFSADVRPDALSSMIHRTACKLSALVEIATTTDDSFDPWMTAALDEACGDAGGQSARLDDLIAATRPETLRERAWAIREESQAETDTNARVSARSAA